MANFKLKLGQKFKKNLKKGRSRRVISPREALKAQSRRPALKLRLKKVSFPKCDPSSIQSSDRSSSLIPLVPDSASVVSVDTPVSYLDPKIEESIGSITTERFLNPNEKLQSSIEGFILDQRSEHTQRAYLKDLKRFMDYLRLRRFQRKEQGKTVNEVIDRLIFIGYKDFLLSEKLEHTTIDRHLATLRSLFGWFYDDGLIEKNPAERIRFLNPKKISKTAGLSDSEVQDVLKQPNLHTKTGAQHYAILMILFYCGIRRSELCSILISNLTKEKGTYLLRLKGKGNKERLIPLIPPVMNAIRYYFFIAKKTLSDGGYLFTPIRNNRTKDIKKHLDPSMIYYIVQRYAKQAGITYRVSPHSCRATAISNARDHQVSDRAIQEFAGWASTDMITRYDKRKTAIENSAAHAISYGSEQKNRLPNYEGATLEQLLEETVNPDKTNRAVTPANQKLGKSKIRPPELPNS